ncbi:MAG: hypothetical protein JOZ87_14835 [Chloroflexi bacterium]|nr:hypothetical protein [Chloroflexota bacterium]
MSSGGLTAALEVRRSRTDRVEPSRATLERAVVQTVAYADVFDYPLTADEIHRYLIGVSAGRGTLRSLLQAQPPRALARSGRYFTLAGREALVETRKARAAQATDYWNRGMHYGRRMRNLPFVRMVAVTGALAMDNMADGDIDYLIITEPGRLWLCRALIVGLVRMAAMRGTELCPNYFLSERALELAERNLFTAHEVTQMVPLAGLATYQQLRDLNRWTSVYLPNASGTPRRVAAVEPTHRRTHRLVESTLRSRVCSPLEHWEMMRKVRKLGSQGDGHAEAAFGPDWCKGHFGDHGQATLSRYAERLQALQA